MVSNAGMAETEERRLGLAKWFLYRQFGHAPSRRFASLALDCWTRRNKVLWFCKNIKITSYTTQHYTPEGQQLMMFMNILTLISDRSYCLCLIRGAEADAQRHITKHTRVKVKVIPQQAEVAQRVPGSFRPRIFLTFGTTRVVVPQPYAPAAFTTGEISSTYFRRLSGPQGTWFRREPRKNPQWHHSESIPGHPDS